MNFSDALASDWAALLPIQKAFYGLSGLAALVIAALALLQIIGLEIHTDVDHGDRDGISFFSVKPLTGFVLGFGWAGGYCLGRMGLVPSLGAAFVAGTALMLGIWGIVRGIMHFQNDGSMRLASAVGREGIVYTTIDPKNGGMIQVALNTGLETLPALTLEPKPISTGTTVTVIRLDGPRLLVESKNP